MKRRDEMKSITRERIEELKKTGHVVHEYPLKELVCVDGFKYYRHPESRPLTYEREGCR